MKVKVISTLLVLTTSLALAGLTVPADAQTAPTAKTDQATVVRFNASGITLVNGKPFFPIGLFTYDLNTNVMAEMHEMRFNTIINGFAIPQLDYIHDHGLMAICFTNDDWLKAAKNHPALLAWYLTDEPESHGQTPETERARYLKLKQADPNHPIGLCHFLFESLAKYKDACDFTMTDVYPITAHRDVPIINVGIHINEAHRVHGANWPNWAYIQVFGGPDTDGGKWAQPLPHEVRCMSFIALASRATGILYFSYWPKAPQTWNSLKELNRDIYRIVPYLVTDGQEITAQSSKPQVLTRARRAGDSGIIIAVNTKPTFCEAEFSLPAVPSAVTNECYHNRKVVIEQGKFHEGFAPYEAKVYLWGDEPQVELAGRN